MFRCFEPISKQPKQTELFRNKPKQTEITLNFLKNTQIYSLLNCWGGSSFVSVQSKHRNSLFWYGSGATETNVLLRIMPKLVSVPVSIVSKQTIFVGLPRCTISLNDVRSGMSPLTLFIHLDLDHNGHNVQNVMCNVQNVAHNVRNVLHNVQNVSAISKMYAQWPK